MKALVKRLRKQPWSRVEDGMVSAEYAVGTVATTSIAGVLIWIAQQDWFRELFAALFKFLFRSFIG
ncbi:DUF4244 domain-containing protein [Arcanobacterium phocae]|uniref:DUF4244 domain-containing protein n=1 Tax=Arcanobacterium phocae TaxID=131112 RepID=UPI001C0E8F68|nr:DUF4244 domain-containing protein [Arcanobacterium phocae]